MVERFGQRDAAQPGAAATNRGGMVIRVLGMLLGVAGVVLAGWQLWQFGRLAFNSPTLADAGILLWIMPFSLIPAGCLIAIGVLARRGISPTLIKLVCGLAVVVLVVPLSSILASILSAAPQVPDDAAESTTNFVPLVVAALLWIVSMRWCLARAGFTDSQHGRIPRTLIGVVCFFGWIWLDNVLQAVFSSSTVQQPPLWTLPTSAIAAWVAYRVITHYTEGLPGLPFIGPPLHRRRLERLARLHEQRIARLQCPQCAYNLQQTLRDNRDTCPECGFELQSVTFPAMATP